MGPFATIELPGGGLHQVRPGDLLGRHWRCALQLPDQRISEAHAQVSLRGGDLRLLGLRGAIAIDGKLVRDPILEAGLTFELAPGMAFTVRDVHLPQRLVALSGPELHTTLLSGTCSLFLSPRPRLVAGHHPQAVGWFFDDGERWFWTHGTSAPVGPLAVGDPVSAGSWQGTLVWKTLDDGAPATLDPYARQDNLRVESYFDVVRLFRGGTLLLQVSGRQARMLAELVQIGQPVSWEAVAREVWSDLDDRWVLRQRWDTTLRRLRRALADAGVRSDLVCSDGTGSVSIVAYPGDELLVMD